MITKARENLLSIRHDWKDIARDLSVFTAFEYMLASEVDGGAFDIDLEAYMAASQMNRQRGLKAMKALKELALALVKAQEPIEALSNDAWFEWRKEGAKS